MGWVNDMATMAIGSCVFEGILVKVKKTTSQQGGNGMELDGRIILNVLVGFTGKRRTCCEGSCLKE